jgi:formyl-CoA transferase
VALGNDRQFRDFCRLLGRDDVASDARFASNSGRSIHRADLIAELTKTLRTWRSDDLLARMEEATLPAGPINRIDQILADPHVASRGLVHTMQRSDGTPIKVIGFPALLSKTPAVYRLAPPTMGQHTRATLHSELGLDETEFARLASLGIVADAAR